MGFIYNNIVYFWILILLFDRKKASVAVAYAGECASTHVGKKQMNGLYVDIVDGVYSRSRPMSVGLSI